MDGDRPLRQLEPFADHGPYSIGHVAGTSETLVIAFSSIGHDPTRPPSPEFIGSAIAGGRPALFVTDALDLRLASVIAGMFVLAMVSLTGSFIYLLREILLATEFMNQRAGWQRQA